jgi:hypothetical protein
MGERPGGVERGRLGEEKSVSTPDVSRGEREAELKKEKREKKESRW